MHYLSRKADMFLAEWKARKREDRFPLIIKGARQVGKTETIRRFAGSNYTNVIEINFVTDPVYKTILEDGYAPESIVRIISRIDPAKRFIPGETLIFFDEIQEYPDIATSLKFFMQEGSYDVICSGSLLGIQYRNIASISVGSREEYRMYSMDFEEFLWAVGYDADLKDDMLRHMLAGEPFNMTEHKKYTDLFLSFCILGGMPRIIAMYAERNTFEESLAMQRQLLIDYESDARKYAGGLDQAKIVSVFRSIPTQLAKENKKFQYAKVRKGGRSSEYMGCIERLEDAGIINLCHQLGFPELPLRGNIDEDKFKVYLADTGLLMASLDDEAQLDVRAGRNLGVYKGALYENFAAEALAKQGYGLYYYKREDSTLEEDFFVRSANELIPVEVKAGSNRAKSMSQLINSDRYPDIRHGIKFSSGNIGSTDTVYTFPYFCLFLLRCYMQRQSVFS